MSNTAATTKLSFGQALAGFKSLPGWMQSIINASVGMGILLLVWWIGGLLIASNPDTQAFADFAPGPTFSALWYLVETGTIWETIYSSLYRIVYGLFGGL